MKTNTMTAAQATEWVYNQDDTDDHHDDPTYLDELHAAFRALYGREPKGEAEERDMWSFCCTSTPHCGTRPA